MTTNKDLVAEFHHRAGISVDLVFALVEKGHYQAAADMLPHVRSILQEYKAWLKTLSEEKTVANDSSNQATSTEAKAAEPAPKAG